MKISKTLNYSDIGRAADGTLTIGPIRGVPDITRGGPGDPAAWFLGPQAENLQLLQRLIDKGLQATGEFRERYAHLHPEPQVIDEEVKCSDVYKQAVQTLEQATDELTDFLTTYATPFAALRYQGHMLWDSTLPGVAGYFAAMLHNPNNVTIQASTATTPLALLLGWDMCKMVGFRQRRNGDPWSHITADGSIANTEATWATREMKFMPFSIAFLLEACQPGTPLYNAREITVTLADNREVALLYAPSWQLFNIPMDRILDLPRRMAGMAGLDDVFDVWNAILPYTFDALGEQSLWQRITARDDRLGAPDEQRASQAPILIAPSTRHYSWPKAAAVTGYGMQRLWDVKVDRCARQPLGGSEGLAGRMRSCLERRIPVAMAVAVMGSTEESAVDPLAGIIALRNGLRGEGLEFNIHADAAWGGYVISAIRKDYPFTGDAAEAEEDVDLPPYDDKELFIDDVSQVGLSDYVIEQFKALRLADSVTIDPHKMGYIQYPSGSVLYRNGEIRRLTTFTGAYIGGIGSVKPGEPTVGIFGLEGSKPGASATATYLSHRVIRPTVNGYGKIVNASLFNAKVFYLKLLALNYANGKANNLYEVVPLMPLPEEQKLGREHHYKRFGTELAGLNRTQLLSADLSAYLRSLGPDLNIVDYVFNPRKADGGLNTDLQTFQEFNKAIYELFHVHFDPPTPLHDYPPMMVTMTTFALDDYGISFMDGFAGRIGLKCDGPPAALNCLRSTLMDPYVTETADGDFLDTLVELLDKTVRDLVEKWRNSEAIAARVSRPAATSSEIGT